MSGEKEVQILMVSAAFQGHLNPMLNFAKRLVLKGAHVTFISTDEARDRLTKSNPLTRLNSDPNIQLEFFSDGLSLDFDRSKDVKSFIRSKLKVLKGEDGIVGREEVERCITEVMEGPKAEYMKKRALELKAAAKKALADGGSSDRNIDHFLNETLQQST